MKLPFSGTSVLSFFSITTCTAAVSPLQKGRQNSEALEWIPWGWAGYNLSQDFYFPNICRIHEDLAIPNPVILFCPPRKVVEPSRRYLVTPRDVSPLSFTGLAWTLCAHFSNPPISTSSKALIVERWMTSLFQFQHMFACLRARNMWISHKLLEFQLWGLTSKYEVTQYFIENPQILCLLS